MKSPGCLPRSRAWVLAIKVLQERLTLLFLPSVPHGVTVEIDNPIPLALSCPCLLTLMKYSCSSCSHCLHPLLDSLGGLQAPFQHLLPGSPLPTLLEAGWEGVTGHATGSTPLGTGGLADPIFPAQTHL